MMMSFSVHHEVQGHQGIWITSTPRQVFVLCVV